MLGILKNEAYMEGVYCARDRQELHSTFTS